MGCGTSANAVGSEDNPVNGHAKVANGNGVTSNGHNGHDDNLPTVRLLHPSQPEISLPDIEEKLAEAELRRQTVMT
ncbi:Uncharacterized protein OBRU01_18669 [Operophtera brumata]|uniref:Uncharacterized protein n=1 Tax=Operophtera brumata TaxID=104452 RepID=A0A0L7KRY6_OPEBR|nr:Uncharacterized protein OBRU01_18669 [Operophtera brumata]